MWKNGLKHGKGCYTWDDGKKYEGFYKNDKKEGKGVFYWSKEKKMEGV